MRKTFGKGMELVSGNRGTNIPRSWFTSDHFFGFIVRNVRSTFKLVKSSDSWRLCSKLFVH